MEEMMSDMKHESLVTRLRHGAETLDGHPEDCVAEHACADLMREAADALVREFADALAAPAPDDPHTVKQAPLGSCNHDPYSECSWCAAPAPEPVAYRWKGMSGVWLYGVMPPDREPGDEPIYDQSAIDALHARIAKLEAALHQITLAGPDRDIKYAGMLRQDIARAALEE